MAQTVYINGRFLSQQITGVQQFAHEICRNLKSSDIEFVLLAPKGTACPDYLSHHTFMIIGSGSGYLWEQVELPNFLRKQGKPLLINLCNTAPLLYRNQFVTIHDLAFMHHPEWFSKNFARVYRYLIPRIVKRCIKIITVSETISKQLQQAFHVNKHNIVVLYNGIANHLLMHSMQTPTTRKPFVLTVSSINPRKNLPFLIQAFNHSALHDYTLLIVGATHSVFGKQQFTLPPNVSFTGYLSNEELVTLYRQSQLFVSLSLDEGFGIPVMEALYCGCPVLLSDIAVYQECFGQVASFTSATDMQQAATDIRQTLERVKNQPIEVSLNEDYSYERSAKKLVQMVVEAGKKM